MSGWCVKNGGQQWIQIDLGTVLELSKVGTTALKMKDGVVKSYSLSYSNNGQSWVTYKEDGKKKVCHLLWLL